MKCLPLLKHLMELNRVPEMIWKALGTVSFTLDLHCLRCSSKVQLITTQAHLLKISGNRKRISHVTGIVMEMYFQKSLLHL